MTRVQVELMFTFFMSMVYLMWIGFLTLFGFFIGRLFGAPNTGAVIGCAWSIFNYARSWDFLMADFQHRQQELVERFF